MLTRHEIEKGSDEKMSRQNLVVFEGGSKQPETHALFDNRSPKELLTKSELAARLKVSTKTIERDLKRGLPSLLAGGRRRFDFDEVMRWLKQRRSSTWRRKSSS